MASQSTQNDESAALGRMITANATSNGHAIYLREDGGWTEVLGEAAVLDGDDQAAQYLARAKADEKTACDPYVIKVHRRTNGVEPVSLKESIRANGPTIAFRS